MDKPFINSFQMEYIDGILIVDNVGKILYSVRYNPRFGGSYMNDELNHIIGKHYLEVYPSINPEDSSIARCLKEGRTIYMDFQCFEDYNGHVIKSRNLTIPIIKNGKTVGAIEMGKDITTFNDTSAITENAPLIDIKVNDGISKFNEYSFDKIITRDPIMEMNIAKAKLAADSSSPVLIYGDTGTGKEIFVRAIHNESARKDKPFIAQNCAAIPEGIFESLLFGSVKGAYTGAVDKKGLFEQADGGTLFLDEINSMSLNLQAKFLRILQDGYVKKVGDDKGKKVNVRVIAAINMNPRQAIKERKLREDVFYRLSVIILYLPTLKERSQDLQLLVNYFIKVYNEKLNRKVVGITQKVQNIFNNYSWPGNIRELEHVIEGAMHFVEEGNIDIVHLPIYLYSQNDEQSLCIPHQTRPSLNDAVEELERNMISDTLMRVEGNISHAAKELKIPRQTLRYKMKKYNMMK